MSKNDTDYMFNLGILDKMCKNLMKGGNSYVVKKKIFLAFKYFKNYSRLHPIFIYHYMIIYFILLLDFQKIRKGKNLYKIPTVFSEEEVCILRTIKLFTGILKKRWNWETDLETKIFSELFSVAFFVKRSKYYSVGLVRYYTDAEENMRYVNFKW